ncbi:MAG TPA: DUF3298 domain-containing protein [bacterium]|nr:DUF3298 domain-containing protein [bacterium]
MRFARTRAAAATLLTSAIALTCGGSGAAVAAVPAAVVYTMRTVERHGPGCSRGAPACPVYIRFHYPLIGHAPSAPVTGAINRAINDFLLAGVGEPKKFGSVAAEMAAFVRKAADYTAAYPGPGYSEDRIVSVVYQAGGIFSLQFDLSWFLGGAHPNYTRTFANFDVRTGRQIRLADVLVARYQSRLTQRAEAHFRKNKGLTPTDSLTQAGYTFPNNTFTLNDNFSIGPKGVTFFYNPYEVASYADGPTELLLAYPEIKDLLRPDGLLAQMRK